MKDYLGNSIDIGAKVVFYYCDASVRIGIVVGTSKYGRKLLIEHNGRKYDRYPGDVLRVW